MRKRIGPLPRKAREQSDERRQKLTLFAVFLPAALAPISASTVFATNTGYTDSSNFGVWPNALNSGNAPGAANGAFGSNPERSAWVLMIPGFIGGASRLKNLRRQNAAPGAMAPAFA